MFRFTIFGIPVEVQPFFWITLVILGGASGADSGREIFELVLFVMAGFISILVHELGHALTARKYGANVHIVLQAFGGYAAYSGVRMTRRQSFLITAAGPGAGFGLFIVILGILCIPFHDGDVLSLAAYELFGVRRTFETAELLEFIREKPFVHSLISQFLWINFWWGMINLLPVLPLDGGRITSLFVRPPRRVYLIGVIAGTAMAVLGILWLSSIYIAVLFGFLAWRNYQDMREARWQ